MQLVLRQRASFAAQIGFNPLARVVAADNFRIAPLDRLQTDVFRALIETLPDKAENRDG